MDVDVAVIGGGVVGLSSALRARGSRRVGVPARERYAARSRHQHAQQRRDSRGPVLPGRLAQGHALRRRARSVVRLLRVARRAARPLRQARRRARPVGARRARTAAGARARQRRHERGARRSRASFCSASRTSPVPPRRSGRRTRASCRPKRSSARSCRIAANATSRSWSTVRCVGATPDGDGIELVTPHETIEAATVVNASGLYADQVSAHPRRADVHDLPVPRRIRRARADAGVTG